ncbi:trigger factor [Candidatus Uhrbacteria bacterium]|nr:trigger factor [Candidatus Uhrbacteria bacterium]
MFKVTTLPKSEVKIEFEIPWEDTAPFREEAVVEISTAKPMAGFRPGKATYTDVVRLVGEMKILETALERIVRSYYVKAVIGEKLETVGSPAVNIDQITPGQPVKFTTHTPIAPEVTKMPVVKDCAVEKKIKKATDKEVEEAIDEMRKMRRTEVKVDRAATMDDLVIVDMEMSRDHVALEGGTGRDYRVYLSEPQYIPGLTKKLEGIKEGEERTFVLPFPEEYLQKHLAGKDIDFKVKASSVHELKMPEMNDEFAKGVGIDTVEELRKKLQENMQKEMDQRATDAAEIEMLEKLVENSSFSEVPEILINEEVRRMQHELQHSIEEQGMKWEDYLGSIKKTEADLKLDFVKQAIRRIQTAVLIKAFAKQQDIDVADEEVDAELDRILENLPAEQEETRAHVSSPDYRDYVKVTMRNRRTLEWVKEQCIK